MAASAPQDEEYEESTDFSWTKKAFEMLESDALHGEVVSREQVVRSRVWGPCPRRGHPLDDRHTHTAVANPMGDTRRSRDETPAFSDGKGVRYFHVDVSSGAAAEAFSKADTALVNVSRLPVRSYALNASTAAEWSRYVRMSTFSVDNRFRATEPPPHSCVPRFAHREHAGL